MLFSKLLPSLALATLALAGALKNPGFEEIVIAGKPKGWTLSPIAGSAVGNEFGTHSGGKALISGAGKKALLNAFGQSIKGLIPGTTYNLQFYAKLSAATPAGKYGCSVEINDGESLQNIRLTPDWKLFSVSFVAGGTNVFTVQSWNSPHENVFDDFSIVVTATGSLVPNRRKRRAALSARDQLRLDNPYCPPGRDACPVKTLAPGEKADLERDGYECLNTQSEYESCGGCASTGDGVDCGTLASQGARPDAITCLTGKCIIYQCRPGFTLLPDGSACIKF